MKNIYGLTILIVLGLFLAGCGGGGNAVVSPFAGSRDIAFYDEDHSNSSWAGDFEVVVNNDGTLDPYGLAYTYGNDAGEKGKVVSGWIKPDRTFHLVAKIDTKTWPETGPLDEPYYMVVDGQVTPSGAHYQGNAQIKYHYDGLDQPAGKDIPYDISIYHLMDRSANVIKTPADLLERIKSLD